MEKIDNLFEKLFDNFVKERVNLELLEERKINGYVTAKDKLIIMIKFLEYTLEDSVRNKFLNNIKNGRKAIYDKETKEEKRIRLNNYAKEYIKKKREQETNEEKELRSLKNKEYMKKYRTKK